MSVMRMIREIVRRSAAQDGFTMVNVMFGMLALGTLTVSAWAVTTGDIPVARADQDHKRAYEAAQAGLQWYAYELDRDSTYWTKCNQVPKIGTATAPVNLEWKSGGADPRVWRAMGTSGQSYTVEIMDKRDKAGTPIASCSTTDAVGTALQNNTLRIRATGKANGKYRSVIATFKRRSFMDFVYFTNSEAQDPLVGGGTDADCSAQRITRGGSGCTEITFIGGDDVNGPLHTNDSSVLATGSPINFGRLDKGDAFEVNGPSPGYVGSGSPTFRGSRKFYAGQMDPPPGNGALKTLAGASWTFTGDTCLIFQDNNTVNVYQNQSWVTNKRVTCTGTPTNRPLTGVNGPPNGVIYVATNSDPTKASNCSYDKYQLYDNSAGCGDVAVSGTYSADVTIGAQNDIIVNGDLKQKDLSDSMLGLVATGFVRVNHPIVKETSSSCGDNVTPSSDYSKVKRIDAAILSLKHSFMVDNYHCGGSEGDLTVRGAIAQWYRGVVGTGNGTTGYLKDYNYDDRLKVREPPNFLDPLKTSWRIVRQTEQQPATKG
jgi:Tfp pilus assembly protein PilX